MIYFCVTGNINIKLIDASLVEYKAYAPKDLWIYENIYATTYDDFNDIKKVFANLKQENIQLRIVIDERFKKSALFPQKIGVSFVNEYEDTEHYETLLEKQNFVLDTFKKKKIDGYLEESITSFNSIDFLKQEIRLAIIGYCSKQLGEVINFCSAIRILHEKLKQKCVTVKIDLYLQASSSNYYKRDKEIFESYAFIDEVKPLSINIEGLCTYDYYINTSSFEKSFYYKELPYIDFFLRQFGLDFEAIPKHEKYNELSLNNYKVNPKLEEKLNELKQKGKLLLFHPYSAQSSRSIPFENSKRVLEKLINYSQEYVVVTILKIDNFKNENFIDLSLYSQTFFDFVYIISQMQYVITVDTATYHISDAFFIPTVVLFKDEDLIEKRLKYYSFVKPIKVKNEPKSFSKFIFKNDALYLDDFRSWNEVKISRVIKLLETIR